MCPDPAVSAKVVCVRRRVCMLTCTGCTKVVCVRRIVHAM